MTTQQKQHPFWHNAPPERKTALSRLKLRSRRFFAWLQGKQQRLTLVVAVYLILWSIPWCLGQPVITVFALLPLLVVPPVGVLMYWLVWKEFHE